MLKKAVTTLIGYVVLGVIIIPFCITVLLGGFSGRTNTPINTTDPQDVQKLVQLEDIETTELETYIIGVVAAEMPAKFEIEALKAQAVAARTYQVRQMLANNSTKVIYEVGQAYISKAERKERWGDNYNLYTEKIQTAVLATEGEIMMYQDEPILAAFHAQSGGMTENAENVWQSPLPYLKSADSHEDAQAPNNKTEVSITAQTVLDKLKAYGETKAKAEDLTVEILERSEAGYVQCVKVGELELTGRELREALGLRSANFTVEKIDGDFMFITKGYGHGAGMSQYGAQFLAEDGLTYQEILLHYYQGISFQNIA